VRSFRSNTAHEYSSEKNESTAESTACLTMTPGLPLACSRMHAPGQLVSHANGRHLAKVDPKWWPTIPQGWNVSNAGRDYGRSLWRGIRVPPARSTRLSITSFGGTCMWRSWPPQLPFNYCRGVRAGLAGGSRNSSHRMQGWPAIRNLSRKDLWPRRIKQLLFWRISDNVC
jgi:hypothetical protein